MWLAVSSLLCGTCHTLSHLASVTTSSRSQSEPHQACVSRPHTQNTETVHSCGLPPQPVAGRINRCCAHTPASPRQSASQSVSQPKPIMTAMHPPTQRAAHTRPLANLALPCPVAGHIQTCRASTPLGGGGSLIPPPGLLLPTQSVKQSVTSQSVNRSIGQSIGQSVGHACTCSTQGPAMPRGVTPRWSPVTPCCICLCAATAQSQLVHGRRQRQNSHHQAFTARLTQGPLGPHTSAHDTHTHDTRLQSGCQQPHPTVCVSGHTLP